MAYINVDEVYILDNTGLQVDMATDIPFVDAGFTDAQKEQARKNIAAGGTNPNLLDNPFFTINQRSFTSGSSVAYTVDRWKNNTSGKTVTLSSGVLTIPADDVFLQPIEPDLYAAIVGKTVTLSVLYSDGTIESGSITVPSSGSTYATGTPRLAMNGTNKQFFCYPPTSISVKAFKLELGTVSTLANDAPPDYPTELAKCQYYFRRVSGDVYLCSGMAVSATAVVFPFPFTMRANPTVTMTGTISAVGSGGILAVSSVNAVGKATNAIQVRLTVSGATQYGAYLLTPSNGGYLDFNADL